eukprot:Clim_evm69s108 gene=Clim_evmTU69s108
MVSTGTIFKIFKAHNFMVTEGVTKVLNQAVAKTCLEVKHLFEGDIGEISMSSLTGGATARNAVGPVRSLSFGEERSLEEDRVWVQQALASHKQATCEKWGFDFDRQEPLTNSQSSWQWSDVKQLSHDESMSASIPQSFNKHAFDVGRRTMDPPTK